ncbi:MAG: RHS repeat-associated core domain-containing protein, partial [Thermoguttaceae bacterium]|nr:RHS repeat-associated core domain-containing protein [Thermoguttaceae bacterium]
MNELYTYDQMNQLTTMQRGVLNAAGDTVSSKTFGEQFTFDMTSNRLNYKQNANGDGTFEVNQTRTHNTANEIQTISGGNTLVSYDRNGCMTKVPKPLDGTTAYTLVYDAWNRLAQVKDDTTVVATYVYDARNHRIKKTVGTVVTLSYFNQNWQEIESIAAGVTTTHVYGIRYIDDIISRTSGSETLHTVQDPNWNLCALVNPSGTVMERITYDSFGRPTFRDANFAAKTVSSYGWSKTFTGQVYDVETGLMLYRNRYYHTGLGRFITRDPIGYDANDVNLYRYVFNWPVRYTDYIGLWGADVHHDMTAVWMYHNGCTYNRGREIADANEETDSLLKWGNISPYPYVGDQGWHFNRNPAGELDSRLHHERENLAATVSECCGQNVHIGEITTLLGNGLHALRDYYAHGDYGRVNLSSDIFVPHNDYGPTLSGIRGNAWAYPDNLNLDAVYPTEDETEKNCGRPAGMAIWTK